MLQSFRHRLIIQNNPSQRYYEDSNLFRVLGIGQGMGWSPTLWGLVNDITIKVMEHNSPGEIFRSPLGREEIFASLEAYVEDVHGGVNLDSVEVFNSMQGTELDMVDATLLHLYKYERYLRSSGAPFLEPQDITSHSIRRG